MWFSITRWPDHPISSDPQLDYGRSTSALVDRRFGDRLHMRMLLQILAQGFAEDAHATAVNDAHPRHSGQESAIYEFLDFAGGFVHSAADDVDFGGHVEAARFVLQRDADAAGARRLHRRLGGAHLHFGNIFASDAHLHRAELDIEMILANFLFDDGGAA